MKARARLRLRSTLFAILFATVFSTVISTESHSIGSGHQPYLIAEIGLNHNGSLDLARRIADAAAEAGAHAAKFQLYNSDFFIDAHAGLGEQGPGSLREFFRAFELKESEWILLAEHVRGLGLDFFCSVFDKPGLDFYTTLNPRLIKISSCDITNRLLIEDAVAVGLPLLISTGTANEEEVARAVEWVGDCPAVLLQCVSAYPARPEDYNLNVLPQWARQYGLPVGVSDHCESNHVSLAAAALGACVVERHFTSDRNLPGPDQALSLEPHDLRELAEGLRIVHESLGVAGKKPMPAEEGARAGGRRSLHARMSERGAGDSAAKMERKDLIALRPGGGVSPHRYREFIGQSFPRTGDGTDAGTEFEILRD